MKKFLQDALGGHTDEQRAYENGFLSGVIAVTGLAVMHIVAEQLRDRRAAE